MIVIGNEYKFMYPEHFVTLPDYSEHRYCTVRVISQLTEPDVEVGDEFGKMYKVIAADGWEGAAFESELKSVGVKRQ